MTSRHLAVVSLVALTMLALIPNATANFLPAYNNISILSPSIPPSQNKYWYENSTINFTASVTLVKEGVTEPPRVNFISYSLDGQPLVYLRNLTVTKYNYEQYNQDLTIYKVTTVLDNLSEGNHTIKAYANDLQTSRTFVVDSHYVVPTLKILSPINQTYKGNLPLEFYINTNFTAANYLMWPKTMDTHFDGQSTGNSTLENLPDGDYTLELTIITQKGDYVLATTHFTINAKGPTPDPRSTFPALEILIVIAILLAIAAVSLVFFKRHNSKTA